MSDWTVEPHDPIPGLEPDYPAVRYTTGATVQERIDHATKDKLVALMRGGEQ